MQLNFEQEIIKTRNSATYKPVKVVVIVAPEEERKAPPRR